MVKPHFSSLRYWKTCPQCLKHLEEILLVPRPIWPVKNGWHFSWPKMMAGQGRLNRKKTNQWIWLEKWEVYLTSLEKTREDHRHHGIVEDNKCQTCVGFDSVIPVLRQLHPFFHLPKDEIPQPTWTRDKLRGMRLPYLTLPYITLKYHIYIYTWFIIMYVNIIA